ncbi:cupin domain-containing protein [Salinicoccus hispanicus]|uniref:Cupin domain-containing protein n=1 Tax=Salinicoccus hispanicus TaxID=157225 RepID=A0A6N8U1R8_9STAP|nr:cupin domain-containing protein [Salinicoccus hispanicus]MXQ52014.1 cupin domain-containing protein [Salinicoccus hispanicus]
MKRIESVEIIPLKIEDDGSIPNNPGLPLLLYKNVFEEGDDIPGVLNANDWSGDWLGSVHPFHHYHSNTHEVLAVKEGRATLQLGGEQGETVEAEKGDVIILPAGYGHKKIEASEDYANYGAYPGGISFDMNYGKAEERPEKLVNIKEVPLPEFDPVFGQNGPLFDHWKD